MRTLLPSLADRDPEVRIAVVGALADEDGDETGGMIDHLLGAIDDPHPLVAAAAIHRLRVLRIVRARAEIVAVLDDWVAAAVARPSEYRPFCVAKAAVHYLADLGPAEAGEHIVPLLKLRWTEIRSLGASAIRRLGYKPAVPALIRALELCVGQAARSQDDHHEADVHAWALVRLGAREAVPALIRIAQEAVGHRSRAVRALIELAPEEAAPHLVPMLNDRSRQLWEGVLKLMVRAEYHPALPAIRALLEDRSHEKRSAALRALGRLRDVGAAEQVRALCLADPNPFVRPVAIAALARLQGEGAVATLEALTHDTNDLVRRAAVIELDRLQWGCFEGVLPGSLGPGSAGSAACRASA